VHETAVDPYARFDRDVWRVACVQCGLAVDDLGFEEAGFVAEVMGRRMCGPVVGGRAPSAIDEQTLSAWTGGLEPNAER
jgi:hypothetical protein